MSTRALIAVLLSSVVFLGCPSKDNQSSSGATSPSGAPSAGAGPLANLETGPFVAESWTSQEGQKMDFIYYTGPRVRISAMCRQPNGQLTCDAIRQVRQGMPVELDSRDLNAGISAGTKACRKLNMSLVSGHDTKGNEDGFCRFPDGSMIANGVIEQYNTKLTQ